MTEADFWRQRYEMLMANFGDMVKAATAKQPVLLTDKESYELGKLHGEISEREKWVEVEAYLVAASEGSMSRNNSEALAGELLIAIRARGQA